MLMRCPNCREKFEASRNMYDHHLQCIKCGMTFNVPFPQAEIVPRNSVTPQVEVTNLGKSFQPVNGGDGGQKVNVIDMEIGWVNMLNICFRAIICFVIASVLIFGLIGAVVMAILTTSR